MGTTEKQKNQIRSVVLSHAHLDHIAGLPLFIDDLFANLDQPVCVYATAEVCEVLEQDIFNWRIYPKFSELQNDFGAVLEYRIFEIGKTFTVQNLTVKAVRVNHKVPSVGFIIREGETVIAMTNDTAQMNEFWYEAAAEKFLAAILIECAFPDELVELADSSHHLTPKTLAQELIKFADKRVPVYIINLKPMYREKIIAQIAALEIENLHILEVGKIYEF